MSSRQKFINIYDEFRTLEMNKEYYAKKVESIKTKLRYMDIFLALFAGGSAILSFGFWSSTIAGFAVGPIFLAVATCMATAIGIARPYFKLEDEHERLSSIQSAYATLAYAMSDVVREVKTKQDVTDVEDNIYKTLRQVRGSFQTKEDPSPDRKLIEEIQVIVNQRHPVDSFYYPPEQK
jgi:hypothetical protein